jgi:hypothetical protein
MSDERTIKLLDIHHPCIIEVNNDDAIIVSFPGIGFAAVMGDIAVGVNGDSILISGKVGPDAFSVLRIHAAEGASTPS